MVDFCGASHIYIIDLTSWSLSQSTKHIQLNPLGSLLILWSDILSDHTSLLSDKHNSRPGKYTIYNCLCHIIRKKKHCCCRSSPYTHLCAIVHTCHECVYKHLKEVQLANICKHSSTRKPSYYHRYITVPSHVCVKCCIWLATYVGTDNIIFLLYALLITNMWQSIDHRSKSAYSKTLKNF